MDATKKKEFIQAWKRFLDDCFIQWKKIIRQLKQTPHNFKRPTPKNQIYDGTPRRLIPLLDIFVLKIKSGYITTDINRESKDMQQYLHFKSNHPQICLKLILCALARGL